jgi:hypothetical protein
LRCYIVTPRHLGSLTQGAFRNEVSARTSSTARVWRCSRWPFSLRFRSDISTPSPRRRRPGLNPGLHSPAFLMPVSFPRRTPSASRPSRLHRITIPGTRTMLARSVPLSPWPMRCCLRRRRCCSCRKPWNSTTSPPMPGSFLRAPLASPSSLALLPPPDLDHC